MKKRFFMLLSALLLSGASLFAQSENPIIQKGDMNEDGNIDISDVVALVSYILNGKPTKPAIEITEISDCPTEILDGGTATITFTTNVPSTISLTENSGEGWSASVSSEDGTAHTITITNDASVSTSGTIPAETIKVIATPDDTDNYTASEETSVQAEIISLNALEFATIIETPKSISDLSYTGNPQNLIEAGMAANGTMLYAVSTTDTQPSSDWSESVPQGTMATTYYVWYKAKGDCGYADSEVSEPITVNISKATPTLSVSAPTSATIEVGESATITVTSDVAGQLTITSPDGTTWSATCSSETTDETTYTITINNLISTTTEDAITAGSIIASFTPTDTDNYQALEEQSVLQEDIKLCAVKAQARAWLDSSILRRTRGNELDHISWSNASVDPSVTTSGTYITLTKGTVTAYYNLEPATTTLHLENISNPVIKYDGYSSYISVGEIQNGEATVSVVDGSTIEGQRCQIKVYDGETLVTTLELRANRAQSYETVTSSAFTTYTHYVGNENKGNITFSDRVKFRALQVENRNTRVTIKASYKGKIATATVTYTASPAATN